MGDLTLAIRELSHSLNNSSSASWSEWILVIITAVYVMATIFICVFNFRSAKATREQVREQKRQFDEINRPNIDITFEVIRGGLACIKIENTGRKSANTISIKINDEFINLLKYLNMMTALDKLNKSSFSLGIGQKWFAPICVAFELEKIEAVQLEIDFSYQNDKQSYVGHAIIDFSQYNWVLSYDSPLMEISLEHKKIAESLKKMSE